MAANDYCTVADIQAAMPDGNWGASYDVELSRLATMASRLIDRVTRRAPGAYYVTADSTRVYDGSGTAELWVDELAAAPALVQVAETGDLSQFTTWAATDYLLWPYNALADGVPYLRLDVDALNGSKTVWPRFAKNVRITGKWGYSTTPPPEIRQAAILLAARAFKRGQQAYRDVGAVIELGQLQYVQPLDPDVQLLLSKFVRRVV